MTLSSCSRGRTRTSACSPRPTAATRSRPVFLPDLPPALSTNVFKYSDARVSRLLDAGRKSNDMAERKADYDELQKTLACEGPMAHLAYANLTTAVGPKLTGFVIHPMGRLTSIKDAVLAD